MILTGNARLGRDAELRYTKDNTAVASLAMAYSFGKKGDEKTQWVQGALFGKQAENLAKYLVKGTVLEVTIADVFINSFTNKDGEVKTSLEGKIVDLKFAPAQKARDSAPAQKPKQESAPVPTKGGGFDNFDDDIPW